MKPGATINPAASKTSAPFALAIFPGAAISAMRSPSSRISRAESDFDAGSRMRPFRCPSHEQVQNGHAHRYSVGHLLEHRGLWPIRNFRSDFRAAINGTGMQDQSIRLGELHAFGM